MRLFSVECFYEMTIKQICFIKFLFVSLLATSLLFFATPTEANAEEAVPTFETYKEFKAREASEANETSKAETGKTRGFEILVSVGSLNILSPTDLADVTDEPEDWEAWHFTNFALSAGYRWKWAGIYIDQTLGVNANNNNFSILLYGAFLSAKYFFRIKDNVEIWGQTGLGFISFDFALKASLGVSFKLSKYILVFVTPQKAQAEEANDSFEEFKKFKDSDAYKEYKQSNEYQEYKDYKADKAYRSENGYGFEFDVGLGYLVFISKWHLDWFDSDSHASDSELSFVHSGQLTLSAGYRWGWIGLYVDQTIAAGQSFLAFSTTIGTKYFYKCTDNLELWGQTSIGGVFIFIFPI